MHAAPREAMECLRQLIHLAQAQREALEADDIGRFAALLESRQAWVDALGVDPAADLPANVIRFPAPTADPGEVEALRALVEAVVATDRENMTVLQARLEALSRSLRQLHHGRRAVRGYGRVAPPSSQVERAG